jgi:hypothetical protein
MEAMRSMTREERKIREAAWYEGRQAEKSWRIAVGGGVDMNPPLNPYRDGGPCDNPHVSVSSTGSWLPERNGDES